MPDTSKAKAKAKDALDRGNHEYAIELMQEILVLEPNDTETRKQLRMASMRYVKQKGISPLSATLTGAGLLMSIKMGKDSDKKMRDCERFLARHPTHKGVLTDLGRAALAGGHFATAIQTFEEILQANGDDQKILRLMADAYEENGDIPEAIEMNRRILKKKPNDQIASRKVKDLHASTHAQKIQEAATSGSARDTLKDKRQTQTLSHLSQEIRTDEDVDMRLEYYNQQLKERPTDARLFVSMGDSYLKYKQKRFDDAKRSYQRAREISPTDNTYQVKLDELEFMRRQQQVAGLEKGGPEHQRASLDLLKFKQERLEWRAGVYTVDLQVKFDLGNVYFQLAQITRDADAYSNAVGCYQQTTNDPKNRNASRLRLGLARARLKEFDLALEEFTEGIAGIELMNQDKMEMIYWRADTYERMQERENALKDFTIIYKVNIGFRDVKQRIEKLRAAAGA